MAGIYIHIPFCRQACHYCDFHFSTSLTKKEGFINALRREIFLQKEYLGGETIETVYFGGGTPSVLSPDEIRLILRELGNHYALSANAEITLEANPDDLTRNVLDQLAETPVNRLSIGVQSFSDEDLKSMNRLHSAEQAWNCIQDAEAAGFQNITVDLIYGIPSSSDAQWICNLENIFSLHLPHLSCYALTIEPRTTLAHRIRQGTSNAPDEEQTVRQLGILMDTAEIHGYIQYEISNFCLPGHHSVHNSNYWTGKKYLGLGPSAHSFNGISRQWNIKSNAAYIQSIAEGKINAEIENLTDAQRYNEYILTSLRTIDGSDLKKITVDFGENKKDHFINASRRYIDSGMITVQNENYFLTREGKYFADRISSDLFI